MCLSLKRRSNGNPITIPQRFMMWTNPTNVSLYLTKLLCSNYSVSTILTTYLWHPVGILYALHSNYNTLPFEISKHTVHINCTRIHFRWMLVIILDLKVWHEMAGEIPDRIWASHSKPVIPWVTYPSHMDGTSGSSSHEVQSWGPFLSALKCLWLKRRSKIFK